MRLTYERVYLFVSMSDTREENVFAFFICWQILFSMPSFTPCALEAPSKDRVYFKIASSLSCANSAMSREIFAVGSLNAAVYMAGKREAGLYRMSDMLAE